MGPSADTGEVGYPNTASLTTPSGGSTVTEWSLGVWVASPARQARIMNGTGKGGGCYPALSLTRMSSADIPITSGAVRATEDGQVSWPDQGFSRPHDTPYRGLKLPRNSAALGRCYLRCGADPPQVSRVRRPWELAKALSLGTEG